MTDDKYPRVRPYVQARTDWDADPKGAKVVPADAIVIERESLPPVTEDQHGIHCGCLTVDTVTTADDAMDDARLSIAIAEYRREHPPVNEAQVEALGHMFADQNVLYPAKAREVARAILATGRVHVDTEGGAK